MVMLAEVDDRDDAALPTALPGAIWAAHARLVHTVRCGARRMPECAKHTGGRCAPSAPPHHTLFVYAAPSSAYYYYYTARNAVPLAAVSLAPTRSSRPRPAGSPCFWLLAPLQPPRPPPSAATDR